MSIQIPNLHTSNRSKVATERALVFIRRRRSGAIPGEFIVSGTLSFNPLVDPYPVGNMTIDIRLNDGVTGIVRVKTVEQLDTTGRATPTAYATGRCDFKPTSHAAPPVGCRYWIMLVDNKRAEEPETLDVIGFLIYDRNGKRVAYGTGPVIKGDVMVAPTTE